MGYGLLISGMIYTLEHLSIPWISHELVTLSILISLRRGILVFHLPGTRYTTTWWFPRSSRWQRWTKDLDSAYVSLLASWVATLNPKIAKQPTRALLASRWHCCLLHQRSRSSLWYFRYIRVYIPGTRYTMNRKSDGKGNNNKQKVHNTC